MQVFVNGEARELADGASVDQLLKVMQAPSEGIAVEVNRDLVRRSQHTTHTLCDGDQVEIVGLVGGG